MKIKKVCIIDDDQTQVYLLTKLTELTGMARELVTYNDARVAIRELKPLAKNEESFPEVFFIDLNMPFMNGWGFLKEFWKLEPPKRTCYYILTSFITDADKKMAEDLGIEGCFLIKPMTVDGLKTIFSEILGNG